MSNLFCLVCSKSFPAGELSGHVASVHFGFLPFACTSCDFIGALESEVLRHADKEGHVPFIEKVDIDFFVFTKVADRSHVKPYLSLLTSLIVGHCQTFAESKNITEILSGLTSQIAANKSGLVGVKCQVQVEPNRDADVSSERSSSTLRSALIPNSVTINSPASITENVSSDFLESGSAYPHSSVQNTHGFAPQNTANVTPRFDTWEHQALANPRQDTKALAAEACALCASNEEFHAEQKEAHVMRHLQQSGASTNQNPAIFFSTIAQMWQRCFPSQTPPSEDVAMETKNDVIPKGHLTKKPKHLKGHVVCTLCDKHVRLAGKQEHVWNEHMDGADRFSCGSCGNKGLAKIDLEQACADLHPDIPVDIKPLAMSVQQHARQHLICFGSYPASGGKVTRSSLSTTPAPAEPPDALLPAATPPIISTNRRCSSRHLVHTQNVEVKQPSPKTDTSRGTQKLHWRHMISWQASKNSKSISNLSAPPVIKKAADSTPAKAKTNECQLCLLKISSASSNRLRNLKYHALTQHFDGPQRIYECSACGYGENAWQYKVLRHVKGRHASDKGVRVFDRRKKYAARIKRCFDACFPSANLSAVRKTASRPASSTEAVEGRPSSVHTFGVEDSGLQINRPRVALAKKQTKNRFSRKQRKPAAKSISGDVLACRLCDVRVRNRKARLIEHAQRHHFQHPQKVYECSGCGYGDNTWHYFVIKHVKKMHADEKNVRVINRYAKLIPKIQACFDSCFPGIGLPARKRSRRENAEVVVPSEDDSADSIHDEPGTSGYAAIGLDTSDNQSFHGFEEENEGDMVLVAIKDEQASDAVDAVSFSSAFVETGRILKVETSDD